MSVQRLDRTLAAYRIGDPHGTYPIFDATGSKRYPGRWNDGATPVIYASRHYSTAMLEKLVVDEQRPRKRSGMCYDEHMHMIFRQVPTCVRTVSTPGPTRMNRLRF